MASPFMMRLATRFIEDGTLTLAVRVMREQTRARQKLAAELLNPRSGSTPGKKLSYISKPEAFHLWLEVPPPWNKVELASHLRVMGVGVVVSDTFTVAGPPPERVRVGLGGSGSLEDCRHQLGIIVDALREHRPG
jgi:DNA-binding transcriptional MocR family regulator